MKIIAILLLSVLASFGIEAPPTKFATLTTTTGRTFKGVTVKKVEVDGISIAHEAGLARIPFEQLSPEIQNNSGDSTQQMRKWRGTRGRKHSRK